MHDQGGWEGIIDSSHRQNEQQSNTNALQDKGRNDC